MEPEDWENLDFVSLLLGFAFCVIGFLLMTGEMLFSPSYQAPPSPQQYVGVLLFVLGIISFVVLESGRNYEQGIIIIRLKLFLLIMMFLLAFVSLGILSKSYITI
jgi:hypothetical protein